MQERVSPSWRAVEAVPVAIAALMITVLASTALVAAVDPPGTAFILSGLAFEVALGGVSVMWVALRHPGSVPALGLGTRRPGRDVVVGVAFGIALFLVTVLVVAPALYALVELFSGGPVTPPNQEVLPGDPQGLQVLLAGVVVVLAAPVGEELFFRGFLFGALRRRFRFPAAAGGASAVFAVFHVIPLLMPLMFVVGFGLAYVYERHGSLVASIAAHAAFNLVGYAFIVRSL